VRTLKINGQHPSAFGQDSYAGIEDVFQSLGNWNNRVVLYVPDPEKVVPAIAVQSIRADADVQSLLRTVRSKNALIFMLKAALFDKLLSGQIVAADTVEIIQTVTRRQVALADMLLHALACFMATVAMIADTLMQIPRQLDFLLSDEVRAVIDWIIILASFYAVYMAVHHLWRLLAVLTGRAGNFVLKSSLTKGETKYIARRLTEHGITHEVLIDGKLYALADSLDTTAVRQDEMALPGSSFFPSKSSHVGAIMVANAAAELSVIGTFFRMDDHLVTAAHVANALSSGVARIFLTGMKNSKKELYHVDLGGVYEIEQDFFALDGNEIKANYDVFARKLMPKQWARISVNRISYRLDSQYNQIVSAYGFSGPDGLFVTSSGKTLPGSGLEELWHTASTHPGFSGSPLFSGSSVVGMHVSAAGDKNVAIRIELIRMLLTAVPESNMPDITCHDRDFKFKGRSAKVKELMDGQLWGFEDSSGRVDLGWTRDDIDEMIELYHRGNPKDQHMIENMMDPDTTILPPKQRKRLVRGLGYEDECAVPASSTQPEQQELNGVIRYPKERPVHCGGVPAENPEVVAYFGEYGSKLTEMGYDPEKYAYPIINAETEATSVVKHLELYHQRAQSVVKPPSESELTKVVMILAEMMENNKFEPDPDYKSMANIIDIIDSSAVRDSKSPGHPYQANGLATNESVINKYTKQGLAELVLKEWNSSEDIFLKMFGKAEPNKREKLDQGMMRVVSGLPLHEMIKHNAIFGNFATSLVDNWKQSPIKFAFNPQRPGDIKHMADIFPNTVSDSDKKAWDYNFFMWLFEVCYRTTQELAVQPADMSDESFQEYLEDIKRSVMRVARDSKYRCTNGEVFAPVVPGGMKSGFFMTIAFNSMGQVALHILTMLRMGYSREQILSKEYAIVAGGDDVMQTFPQKFPIEKYQQEMRELGFDVTDFKTHPQFEGCEFFSNKFHKRDGAWIYTPTRFTKHVAHLKHTKLEFLASALSCHMLNHVWDERKFSFFEKMFRDFRKKYPEHFPMNLIKKRRALQWKVLGLESC